MSELAEPGTPPGPASPAAPEAAPKKPSPHADPGFVRNTLLRLGTAVVGIPILLWAMFVGPSWTFQVIVLACIARAAHELMRMTMHEAPLLHVWGVLATLFVAAVAIFVPPAELALLGVAVLVPGVGTLLALNRPEPNEAAALRLAWLVGGPLWLGGLLGSVGHLHRLPHGGAWVLLAMWIAWASDTGAYFAGRYFGARPLAPRVSPKKTVEGALGGLAGSLTGALAAHFGFMPDLPLPDALVLGLVAGALGQMGDLVESLVKRGAKVKDSGAILPGHGGLLDRVDALMFTASACLLYAHLVHAALHESG